jgi:hypothetical protein
MKTPLPSIQNVIHVAFLFVATTSLRAQGTAFTYQGRLNHAGQPANGMYDLQFAIYDSPGGGTVAAGPLTNTATAVSNGLFTPLHRWMSWAR